MDTDFVPSACVRRIRADGGVHIVGTSPYAILLNPVGVIHRIPDNGVSTQRTSRCRVIKIPYLCTRVLKLLFTMAIKVKAVERNVSFDKNTEKWAYVLQADLYNKLSQSKVIGEAALRSGIAKGAINAAWDAIGEVIKAWATEGHSVAVPGLGTMRFGLRSKSIADVNKVGSDLITTRRVIFTPNVEIKDELKKTSINITCYDRNGEVVKRVTSTDDGEVEDPENEGGENTNTTNPTNGGGSGSSQSGSGSVTPTDPEQGSNTGGGGGGDDSPIDDD